MQQPLEALHPPPQLPRPTWQALSSPSPCASPSAAWLLPSFTSVAQRVSPQSAAADPCRRPPSLQVSRPAAHTTTAPTKRPSSFPPTPFLLSVRRRKTMLQMLCAALSFHPSHLILITCLCIFSHLSLSHPLRTQQNSRWALVKGRRGPQLEGLSSLPFNGIFEAVSSLKTPAVCQRSLMALI